MVPNRRKVTSMADAQVQRSGSVNTVLGPIPAHELGAIAVHEALLSVVPGAQYAPDIRIDRAEIFETLAAQLRDFATVGGGAIVDSTGMFHGRDVTLLESLSRATGVHIIGSTGMGPEEMLGGYFLTPQTNPPTPWPAEKFAELFRAEVTDGMVVPRVERRGPAGLVTSTATRAGMTATDESLFRGAARAALATGIPVSIRTGSDPLRETDIVLDEGIAADRVLVGGLDRVDARAAVRDVAARGVFIGIDSVGQSCAECLSDDERVKLVVELIEAGYSDRIILSSGAIGVAKGLPGTSVTFSTVLSDFVPQLRSAGVSDDDIHQITVENPLSLLTIR